jgi:hypothetical protein
MLKEDRLVVLYSCGLCGTKDRPVATRWREPGEDVRPFMEYVILTVGQDHMASSPRCSATKLTDLKVPIPPGTEGIGERPVT